MSAVPRRRQNVSQMHTHRQQMEWIWKHRPVCEPLVSARWQNLNKIVPMRWALQDLGKGGLIAWSDRQCPV